MESNTVLIKVEGGSLTEEELIGHLKRIVSSSFEWDVQIFAPNIEEEDEYFGHELPTVWMRTVNLPKVLRTYEVLWAIGTMFGATQKVDMITTRKNKYGRFKVAVLNPTIVPTKMDCVIGTRFFELRFVIEPFNPSAESDTTQKERHDDNDGEDNKKQDADTEMEDASKKPKRVDSSNTKFGENKNHGPTAEGMQQDENGFNLDEDDLLDECANVGATQVPTLEAFGGDDHTDMVAPLESNADGAMVEELPSPTHVVSAKHDMGVFGADLKLGLADGEKNMRIGTDYDGKKGRH
ncbi:unnamed protein product [Urochloa humidicola]